ncbi:SDR family oxidoreductase [Haladaptatus sp. CMAA 1911]|uniref:SDR family oxidoreductase n=1 Tax=unclassified Haladaptatus TaxID=2622732 RepID=UPI003753FAA5
MDVLVAGSHGQVGRRITDILSRSDHTVRGMVRDETQVADIEAMGAEAVVADLTQDVSHAVTGHDAIIFAAGSGGDDVWGVDRDGAIGLIEAAEDRGVERFVMLSSINADSPEDSPDALQEYLAAKAEADDALRESELTCTIVRPGPLTNDPGTGRIRIEDNVERDGDIPRADVARTLVTALPMESTYGRTFEILSGDTPIQTALETLR